MKLLREYVRQLLTEGAKGLDDLVANDMYVVVGKDSEGDALIYYSNKDDLRRNVVPKHREKRVWGDITIVHSDPKVTGPCSSAMSVEYVEAAPGWGPMLYDVAIEIATQEAGGLAPDRKSVSKEAKRVWDYYLHMRGDVQSHQLDLTDEDIEDAAAYAKPSLQLKKLTPDIDTDDCLQTDSIRNHKGNWDKTPTSKRYTKPPTTLKALRDAGRLIES